MNSPKIQLPNVLNVMVEPQPGPNETSFYLPTPTPGGLRVLQFGGWSKRDALTAQILIGWRTTHGQTNVPLTAKVIGEARNFADEIMEALALPEEPPTDSKISCPRDTNGDGDCGRPGCPDCGQGTGKIAIIGVD